MGKAAVKILREFYREQNKKKAVVVAADPDDDTRALVRILSGPNPICRIAKRRNLSFTTTEGDAIVRVNPDNSRVTVGEVQKKDVRAVKRQVRFR